MTNRMCDLSSDVNNTPKKIPQGWKIQVEIYIGNTIKYDVKSYQVKTFIVKCTELRLKVFKLDRLQK